MLSDCAECQYFHAEACGVNPYYRKYTTALPLKLSTAELEYFANDLPSCPDWERTRDLEPVTHSLTLTRAQWRDLAEVIASQELVEALPEELRPAEPEATDEIVMHPVESSNIAAIGWRARVCQVDFCNGSRYQYFDVPEWVYQNFLDSYSKGRYLNEVFKGEYSFEYQQTW